MSNSAQRLERGGTRKIRATSFAKKKMNLVSFHDKVDEISIEILTGHG